MVVRSGIRASGLGRALAGCVLLGLAGIPGCAPAPPPSSAAAPIHPQRKDVSRPQAGTPRAQQPGRTSFSTPGPGQPAADAGDPAQASLGHPASTPRNGVGQQPVDAAMEEESKDALHCLAESGTWTDGECLHQDWAGRYRPR